MKENSLYLALFVLSLMITTALLVLQHTDWLIDVTWTIITVLWFCLYLHKKYWRDEKNEKNEKNE